MRHTLFTLASMTLLLTVVLAGVPAGCGDTTTSTTLPATTTQPTVSLADWRSMAEAVMADFHNSFVEGQWAGSTPYATAAEDLSKLPRTSEESPATFVRAMKDAATAVEAFSIEIKQRVASGDNWQLTEEGHVWAYPAGAAFFESREIEFPRDIALTMLTALDGLERSAGMVGLEGFLPWVNADSSTSTTRAYTAVTTEATNTSMTVGSPTTAIEGDSSIPGFEWLHNPVTNHYYALTGTGMSWDMLEALAVQLGGHLVSINNAEEEEWLFYTFGSTAFWIGLTDYPDEGTFRWTSGEPVGYLNWLPGEPSDTAGGAGTEDAVYAVPWAGGWNDEVTWTTEFWNAEQQVSIPSYPGVIEVEDPPPSFE